MVRALLFSRRIPLLALLALILTGLISLPVGNTLWTETLALGAAAGSGGRPESEAAVMPTPTAAEFETAPPGSTVAGTPTPSHTLTISAAPGEQPAVTAAFTASPSATQPSPTATPTHTATVTATPAASATITPAATDTPVPSIVGGEPVVEETQVGN
jgi:hypothetical protein